MTEQSLQDDKMDNGIIEKKSKLDSSLLSTTSSGSSLISVPSENSLNLGGTIFEQLSLIMKQTYLNVLRCFDPAIPYKSDTQASENILLNRDQLASGLKRLKLVLSCVDNSISILNFDAMHAKFEN